MKVVDRVALSRVGRIRSRKRLRNPRSSQKRKERERDYERLILTFNKISIFSGLASAEKCIIPSLNKIDRKLVTVKTVQKSLKQN